MILYTKTYEREGNDAWLIDYVELHQNSLGLYLDHKKNWNGWAGEVKESNTLYLDIDNLEQSQEDLEHYLDRHNLEEEVIINLSKLISQDV